MSISSAIFRRKDVRDQHDQQHRVCSTLSSSPVVRLLEGKAAAIVARGASWHDVSTAQWREHRRQLFSTAPETIHYQHLSIISVDNFFGKINDSFFEFFPRTNGKGNVKNKHSSTFTTMPKSLHHKILWFKKNLIQCLFFVQ